MTYKTYKQEETWADIQGYEGIYQVSDLGHVRSLDRTINHPHCGKVRRKGKILKHVKNADGYDGVFLYINGKSKRCAVHRLVAETFCEKPEGNVEVNHLNENREDNRASNLEWISHADNVRYGTCIEKRAKAFRKPGIATDKNGVEHRFESLTDAAKHFGFLRGEISRCCRGIYKTYHDMTWRYAEEV